MHDMLCSYDDRIYKYLIRMHDMLFLRDQNVLKCNRNQKNETKRGERKNCVRFHTIVMKNCNLDMEEFKEQLY